MQLIHENCKKSVTCR